jgi:NAD(P)-dependent dehydrogenase (short-subunit alcohol dehydrogenase family)
VVTGGSGGMGAKICEELSLRGGRVFSVDVVEPKIKIPQIAYLHCDVTDAN